MLTGGMPPTVKGAMPGVTGGGAPDWLPRRMSSVGSRAGTRRDPTGVEPG